MVTKAVIPAAGFGTRFLPATKSQPKEMMPVVDTPTIQYVVEEAVAAGITDILMVIGKNKRAIEEHFDRNFELEAELAEKNKTRELEAIRHISELADLHFVWQRKLNGLGDAIAHARLHVGEEPFAVLLGDTVLRGEVPVTRQLVEVFDRYRESVVALEEVPDDKLSRYGVIAGDHVADGVYRIRDFVEKPLPREAPSSLAVAGRYVLTPAVFDCLARTGRGRNEEIQLTDALRLMVAEHPVYGLRFAGRRFDIGNVADFLKTNVILALEREDLREEIRAFIKDVAAGL